VPTAFAAAQARLGASTLARLGNASITLANATVVDGMLRNVAREARVGIGMNARDIEFVCPSDEVSGLAEGAAVTVTYCGAATSYKVARRYPDDVHLGQAILALCKA
jgi:hypothetical protein